MTTVTGTSYKATPCANDNNERPRKLSVALPVGVSLETGATEMGGKATMTCIGVGTKL